MRHPGRGGAGRPRRLVQSSLGPGLSALPPRPFPRALITGGRSRSPPRGPHRQGPAAVQTPDGRLSFPLTPKLHKGTAWGRTEGSAAQAKGPEGPGLRESEDHQEVLGQLSHLYWCRPGSAGRCTPRCGRRAGTGAAQHPRPAACPASPRTASGLLGTNPAVT